MKKFWSGLEILTVKNPQDYLVQELIRMEGKKLVFPAVARKRMKTSSSKTTKPCPKCHFDKHTGACFLGDRHEYHSLTSKEVEELIRSSKYPALTKKESAAIWKRINEKLFSEALLEFKNEIVDLQRKIAVSRESHEQGMKGSDKLSMPWNWHQGYRDADNWISSLLDKSFATLGKKIMGIDPIGLPLAKKKEGNL